MATRSSPGPVGGAAGEFNLADLFERAVDAFGDRDYLLAEDKRRTYAEMEGRANRLAHHLAAHGVGPGDHVGIYAYNSVEWVEALWAVFKLRAVWVNINYRYVDDELRYLFDNADLVALIYQREFAPRVAAVRDQLPQLRHSLVIEDDSGAEASGVSSVDYEEALASASPERDFGPRSGKDLYLLYTGGTTGMPKGVVWHHEDVFFALGGGIDPRSNERVVKPEEMVEKGRAGPVTSLPIAPLMHGATQWAVMGGSFVGNKVVLVSRFDPHGVWHLVEKEQVNLLMVTGDAMARPLVEALEAPGASHDVSSLLALVSTAAIFSPTVKDAFFRRLPDLVITDAIGASETGSNGLVLVQPDHTAMRGGPTVQPIAGSVVLDDDLEPVVPGSGVVGKLARMGDIPVGYYKDPEKTAATFVEAQGVRYAIPGDFATVEADGTITLLGRGSQSINSGGEKIFPEEVEAAVKSHPDVYDAVVVGVPDERWGQRVAAVVQPRPGAAVALEPIQTHCRTLLAGYKVPRQLHVVETIQRSPSGKPDYPWALSTATSATPAATPAGPT
ncbi:MAG TPA: acyl-CoA synthetase [Acidimicrobiales bacterium]|jgi:acyl-CoA synthetase (AMP-forming)/AMP-acid ligase II|nr:acyl-CoA synthetase [Acidimicrobiales bacterium]